MGKGSVPDLARDRVGLYWANSGMWLQCQTSAGQPLPPAQLLENTADVLPVHGQGS